MSIKKITRGIAIAALFLIPIFPLIVANNFFFPFITGKAFYFRILVEIAFASWLILALLDTKYRPRINPLTIGVTVFALVALVADLVGVNPMRSLTSNFERMEGWVTIAHLWMFFMATTGLFGVVEEGKRLWQRWISTSLIVAFFVSCYGFFQVFGWAAIHQSSDRVDASLGNAEYMAVYMLINVGFALYLFFEARKTRNANTNTLLWWYGILAAAFSFLIFETGTRGTTIALAGGAILTLLLYTIFAKGESYKKYRYISGSIIIGIILLGGLFWGLKDTSFVKNNPNLNRLTTITLNDITTSGRAYIWPMAIKGFTQRPVLGWGQENFNYIFNANYNPKMWGQEQWFDRAHSVYLDWLVAGGAVGLLAYLSLYFLALLAIWKSNTNIAERSMLTGLLAAYAAHNVLVFDNLASYVLFFAFLGFVSSLQHHKKEKVHHVVAEKTYFSTDTVEYVFTPIIILGLIAGVYFTVVRPVQANIRLIGALQDSCSGSNTRTLPSSAGFANALALNSYVANQEIREQLLQCSVSILRANLPNQVKQEFYELTIGQIQDQITATPKDARIYTLAGSFMNQVGGFTQAENYLKTAHQLSPKKQTIDFELGNTYLNLGKYDEAINLFKESYELVTENTTAKSAYIVALIAGGKESVAKQLFGDDPSNFNNSQVAQAYVIAKQYSKAITVYKSLIGTSTDNIDLQLKLAQAQFTAGLKYDAVATFQLMKKNHPEYATQIDAMIKEAQK